MTLVHPSFVVETFSGTIYYSIQSGNFIFAVLLFKGWTLITPKPFLHQISIWSYELSGPHQNKTKKQCKPRLLR